LSQLSHDQIAIYTNSDISSIWFKNKKKGGVGVVVEVQTCRIYAPEHFVVLDFT